MAKIVIEGVSKEYAYYFAKHVQKEHPETKGHVKVLTPKQSKGDKLNPDWWSEWGKGR